jgi:transposase
MIGLPAGTRIWLAAGVTDMRSGMNGLATKAQTALAEDPFSGHVFLFRGRRGDMIKVLWWSGDGMCLLAKRLERGRFVWPQAANGSVALTQASWRCCSKESTGVAPNALGNPRRPCKHIAPHVSLAHAQPSRSSRRPQCPQGIAGGE